MKTWSDRFGGHARALAVSNANIAVGTSRGLVLIFDFENRRFSQCFLFEPFNSFLLQIFISLSSEALLMICRLLHSITSDGCPVSCLDFNKISTLLAIGYGSGLIRTFNVATGKVLDNVSDIVQPGQGVLQVLFCARCNFYSFRKVCFFLRLLYCLQTNKQNGDMNFQSVYVSFFGEKS